MASKCWHGGDYEGNGIFAFLGKRGYGKSSDMSKRGSSRDYTDAIEYAQFFRETFVRQEIEHTLKGIGNVSIRPKHHLLESHLGIPTSFRKEVEIRGTLQ